MIQFNKKMRGWVLAGAIALLSTLGLSSSMLPAAQGDAPGMEIPVSKKKVSQTIRKRFAYTVSYNHYTRQPNWVAWTLTRAHASGKLKRGDFEDDMDMPSPKGTKADYYNSGYDRGHLCPAGDNKWNQKAMDECFLMTNMCPQTHALNAGIWNSIEQQCRTWAKKYGKVYIVCGPIFLNTSIANWVITRWWCLMLSSRLSFAPARIRKPSALSVAIRALPVCRRRTLSTR